MASDLISREALLEDLRESVNWLHKIYGDLKYEDEKRICGAEIASFSEVIMRVKDFPAVDAVEVVRCKDCQERTQSCGMVLHCRLNGIQTDDDDFCSYGRKLVEKDAVD